MLPDIKLKRTQHGNLTHLTGRYEGKTYSITLGLPAERGSWEQTTEIAIDGKVVYRNLGTSEHYARNAVRNIIRGIYVVK